MSYGLRPFFARLGVALRGPADPALARRAERARRIGELQRVINQAADYAALGEIAAWQRLRAEWAARVAELVRALRTSSGADFAANQAALDAYEEATTIISRALDAAQEARAELETLAGEEDEHA